MADGTVQRIHKLPDSLINKIAAGEVIERPASVVKELLENSLDAGATRINIDIHKGGSRSIRVEDNGHGIHPDDLLLAVDRHTTSKIHYDADLWKIRTLGFRGEALSSIASVSRFTLTTKQNGSDRGWSVKLSGKGTTPVLQPAAHYSGTTVEVQDLFYNIPARRRFLRSERTEFIHIHELVKRIALSRFNLAIRFIHNGRQILNVQDDQKHPAERLAAILGRAFADRSMIVDEHTDGMHLYGWVGRPDAARNQTDLQYFYLNGRMVKDRLLGHAVRLAFQDKLYSGRYPVFLLYLEMDTEAVDINVHPAKQEVRFRDARNVHDFIYGSLQRMLNQPALAVDQKQRRTWEGHIGEPDVHYRISSSSGVSGNTGRDEINAISIGGRYIVMEEKPGALIIDVHRAREYIAACRLKQEFAEGRVRSRPVLVPLTCKVSTDEADLIEQNQALLEKTGVGIQRISQTELFIRELPQAIAGSDAMAVIRSLISRLKQNTGTEKQSDSVLEVLVCHANDGDPDHLTQNEIHTMLTELRKIKPGLSEKEYQSVLRHIDMQTLQELLNG